jgi:hypothetical protein
MTDRISTYDASRKWGIYYVVGLVLKCYFRVRRPLFYRMRSDLSWYRSKRYRFPKVSFVLWTATQIDHRFLRTLKHIK